MSSPMQPFPAPPPAASDRRSTWNATTQSQQELPGGTSLVVRSDLVVLGPAARVKTADDWMAIRTPSLPTLRLGNAMLFAHPPTTADVPRWCRLLETEVGAITSSRIGWHGGRPTDAVSTAFRAAGFIRYDSLSLVTATAPPAHPVPGISVDLVVRHGDWADLEEFQLRRAPATAAGFIARRLTLYRSRAAAGTAAWFVARHQSRVIGCCGAFTGGPMARLQGLETAAEHRRAGIGRALAAAAGQWALQQPGVGRLVAVADPDYHAAALFESLGLRRHDLLCGVVPTGRLAPADHVAAPGPAPETDAPVARTPEPDQNAKPREQAKPRRPLMRQTSAARNLKAAPINPSIGAEVTGVDLTMPLDPATAEHVRALLHRHKVLIFPEQDLTAPEFEHFIRVFGDPFPHPTMPRLPDNRFINPVETSHGPAKDWHIGGPWRQSPFVAELLQLKVTPPAGGDTMWADLQLAYRTLSKPFRDLVDQLSAVYLADPARYSPTTRRDGQSRQEVTHPLVITHPDTGEKGLYYSTSAIRLEGLESQAEQDAIRALLLTHATQPRVTLRHRWRTGDIAVWDNRAVWHRAVDDYGDVERVGWHASVTSHWTPA